MAKFRRIYWDSFFDIIKKKFILIGLSLAISGTQIDFYQKKLLKLFLSWPNWIQKSQALPHNEKEVH